MKSKILSVALAGISIVSVSGAEFASPNPNASAALAKILTPIGYSDAGMGSAFISIDSVSCHWRNGPNPPLSSFVCDYSLEDGKTHTVSGSKATILISAIDRVKSPEVDCGAGTCGYMNPQDVSCRFPDDPSLPKHYDCNVSNAPDDSSSRSSDAQPAS